jgi:hypothetical protein
VTTPSVPEQEPAKKAQHRRSQGEIISDRAATTVIYVVTTIWAINILAGMFSWNDYKPSTEVNGIFMAVVGGAFIARTRSRSGGGDS